MKNIYNIQIERALLATILFDPNIFLSIDEELDSNDFGYKNYGEIYKAIRELHRADLPIEESFIKKQIDSTKIKNFENDLNEILIEAPLTPIKPYIQEIKDLSLKRKLHRLANIIQEKSTEASTPSIDIINAIESEVFNIQGDKFQSDFRNFDDVTESMLQLIGELKQRGNATLVGIDTGFYELNKMTAGFKEGELIIIAARPAMGKTALAINLIQPTLKNGKGVAFFSLEMEAESIALRMFSSLTSIPLQDLRVGNLNDNDWQYFATMCDKSLSWKLYIDDGAGLNISQLRSKLRKLKSKDPTLSLVVIDYLQIMSGVSNKDRHLEIAEISRGLKNLARELKLPIIALSQLNRSLESRSDRRPMLSDLRESGSIEQDADIILFLYRDAVYKRRDQREKLEQLKKEGKETPKDDILIEGNMEEAELIIGKHRNGPTGTIKLNMYTKYTRFTNLNSHNDTEEYSETKMLDTIDDVIPI